MAKNNTLTSWNWDYNITDFHRLWEPTPPFFICELLKNISNDSRSRIVHDSDGRFHVTESSMILLQWLNME